MDSCINHPDHAAIEHCEVCGDPLCDLCLWYGDDGRRLCEQHARAYEADGGTIQSPALYEEGIQVKEVDAADIRIKAPYTGNDNDVSALVSVVLGFAALSAWFGGVYCLPVIAGVLGIVGLSSANRSLNPKRTRTLSLVGIGLSAVSLLPILFFICFFTFTMVMAFASTNFGP